MRCDFTSITVMPFFTAMDFTGTPARRNRAVMVVPLASGRREFRIRTGMFRATAGSIVAGCSTRAPKYASSAASSKDSSRIFRLSGTIR